MRTAYNLDVSDQPEFLRPREPTEIVEKSFQPHPPERKGETLAWLCTVGVLVAGLIIQLRSGTFPELTAGLAVFFGLAAVLITFGNWMEAGTRIRVTGAGIHYQNPFRNVAARWGEIRSLRAVPLRRGWRITVTSDEGRFFFRTPARIDFGSYESMQLGVSDGMDLVQAILRSAHLTELRADGEAWVATRPGVGGLTIDKD